MTVFKFAKGGMCLFLFLCILAIQPPKKAEAGIPVIDVAGLVQAVLTAIENVTQTLQLIDQYRTQLSQYENMLINTVNPDTWIWDRAQQTMNDLRRAVDTIDRYKTQYQSIDGYLGNFKDLKYYQNNPCLTSAGCTSAERKALDDSRVLASESQKRANDAVFKGLEIQQDSIESDARQLERLQVSAQTAEGQVQAIQYANQFASNQANQLLHIRSLMVAQQTAAAALAQGEVNKQAQQDAANQKLREPVYSPSENKRY